MLKVSVDINRIIMEIVMDVQNLNINLKNKYHVRK